MNLKKFVALCCSSVIALASLFSLGLGGQANASGTPLYWCSFAGGSFNNPSNWSIVSGSCSNPSNLVPGSGDDLIFNASQATSTGESIVNDISNLSLDSITFVGSGTGSYTISSSDITLANGVTDTSSNGLTDQITSNINLSASQNISTSGSNKLVLSGNLNLGSNSATISSGSSTITLAKLTGSGALNFASPGSGIANYDVNTGNSSTFSGPVNISSNVNVSDTSGSLNGLGSGTITVNNGGSLTLNGGGNSGTLANNLVLSGSGDGSSNYGALISCLGSGGCSTSTINLTGTVTLSGNAQLVNGSYTPGNTPSSVATFNISKLTANGHTLSAVGSSGTVINLIVAGGASTKTPGSPNSGEGLIYSRTNLIILGTLLISSALVIIGGFSKRSKTSPPKK